ncbi:hypothetical protein D9M68_320010 [compost metagenome]
MIFEILDNLRKAKETDSDDDEVDAVEQLHRAECQALLPRNGVDAYHPQEQTEQDHANGFQNGSASKHGRRQQAEQH